MEYKIQFLLAIRHTHTPHKCKIEHKGRYQLTLRGSMVPVPTEDDRGRKGQGSDVLDANLKLDSEDSAGCPEQTGREVPKAGKPSVRKARGPQRPTTVPL